MFAQGCLDLGAPAARWPALEHMRVMEQTVEQRGDGGGVAEQLTPVLVSHMTMSRETRLKRRFRDWLDGA